MRGYGPYAVVEKSSGKMIGPVGLWYPGDWPEPEIKWSLSREFWGKGYAAEAARAVQTMAFQRLKRDRLISLILPENEASKRLAKRLGGTYEKTIPFRDALAEIYVYSSRDTLPVDNGNPQTTEFRQLRIIPRRLRRYHLTHAHDPF